MQAKTSAVSIHVFACRLYAYEGVGMLLGQEELAAEEQHAYIAALLQPLIQQVCRALSSCSERKWS